MTETPDLPPIIGPVRTRFAPSPTGRLHLGNVRTAVFNWLFTRHHGGAFVLRIEDTDTERNLEGSEGAILEDLRWLGLDPDEGPELGGEFGPYRQSERGGRYAAALQRLRAEGHVYPCFGDDDAEEGGEPERGEGRRFHREFRDLPAAEAAAREAAGEPFVLRFRVPDVDDVTIVDRIRGPVRFAASEIDDFVVARRDGRPTYNFAVVVDDIEMGITDVIRGAGHLSNTPRQQLIYAALGGLPPRFAHLPTVLSPEGGKLSKRSGAAPVSELRERGIPPEAVVNYLSLLGWSHPEEQEILTTSELVATLDLDRVGAADTRYDPEKFAWVSGQHLALWPEEAYLAAARARVDRDRFPLREEALDVALRAIRSRLRELSEVPGHLAWVVPQEGSQWEELRDRLRSDPEARRVVSAVRDALAGLVDWEAAGIKDAIRDAGKAIGARGARLFVPVRMAVTADEHGPELGALLEAAGRSSVLERLEAVTESKSV